MRKFDPNGMGIQRYEFQSGSGALLHISMKYCTLSTKAKVTASWPGKSVEDTFLYSNSMPVSVQ
jgi:hypothetical protein